MDILNEQILRAKELMGILNEQDVSAWSWEGTRKITNEGTKWEEIELSLKLLNKGKLFKEWTRETNSRTDKPTTEEQIYELMKKDVDAAESKMDLDTERWLYLPELKDFKTIK